MLEIIRIENQVTHDKNGETIAKLRSDVNGEIAKTVILLVEAQDGKREMASAAYAKAWRSFKAK